MNPQLTASRPQAIIRPFFAASMVAAWLAFGGIAHAQPSFTVTFGRALDSFSGDGDTYQRQRSLATVAAEHKFNEEHARLFYSLDSGTFSAEGNWSYYLHSAGMVYRVDLKQQPTARLFLSGWGALRNNGTSWAAADFHALGAMANVEVRPSATSAIRFGYRLDVRRFPDLTEINHSEHDGFVSGLVNLPSRTTLIGEVHLAGKSYEGSTAWIEAPVVQTSRGMGPGLRRSATVITGERRDGQAAGLVLGLVRVAQSLAEGTGASFQLTRRQTFGSVPPAVVTTPALFFDDGVYDDPFASDATTLRATVKRVFTHGSTLEGSIGWTGKDYNSTPALDSEGLPYAGYPLRADRLWRANAGWALPLLRGRAGPWEAELSLD
jgi:hypothetical protein